LMLIALPGYLGGKDLAGFRKAALTFSNDPGVYDLHDWLRQHTAPSAVILCDDAVSIYTVAPAGRGVVSLPENYSNPYVARERRAADRDLMFEAIRNQDASLFARLAAQYRVRAVIFRADAVPNDPAAFKLKRVGRFGRLELHVIDAPDPQPGEGKRAG